MKHQLLLSAVLLIASVSTGFAQATYTIDWNYPDTLHARPDEITIKRTGTMRNLNDSKKDILFRYNIEKLLPEFSVGFCFGDLCYFQFPGEDDPYERDPQTLPASGTLPVYSLCNKLGKTEGTSTVWYEMFDKNDTTDKLPFYITYVYGDPQSVTDARDLGISSWPNPSSSTLNFSGTEQVVGANVYNTMGVLLRTFSVQPEAHLVFDIHDLAPGAYHMVLTMANGSAAQSPFVVAR